MRLLEAILKLKFAMLAMSSVMLCTSCSNLSNLSRFNDETSTMKSNGKSGNSVTSIRIDNRILNNETNYSLKKIDEISQKSHVKSRSNASEKSINQSNAWKHSSKQSSVWSCHAFVAAGLVEAEYYQSTGERIDLSEADLFLKHIKQNAPNWDAGLSDYLDNSVNSKGSREQEIGHVHESYNLIQKRGIATEDEIKYSPVTSIGLPLTMSILRNSVNDIMVGVEKGGQQNKLTAREVKKIKKGAASNLLTREEKYFASRDKIKKFASRYTIKSIDIYHNVDNTSILKNMLNLGVVGLNYKVPSYQNPFQASPKNHTLIVTGYDAKRRAFTVRDSNYKGLFGKSILKEDFVKRFGTKIYYLRKR